MQFIGWSFDIARDQAPSLDLLGELVKRSAAAGCNALGLYLEHRFAYRSAPWAAGAGCVTPEMIRAVASQARQANLRIIPMLSTLGHMEGFIRAEGGQWLAEGGDAAGMLSLQMCASRKECRDFARGLVRDAIDAFDDPWVHLGGDESRQLGNCPACAARVAAVGRGGLYGEYYGELCRWVLRQGRRPCLWGDMLLALPEALPHLPRETVIFDWQYDHAPAESARVFLDAGFDVVCCPALHTFDSGWCFLAATQRNIDEHAAAARSAAAAGGRGALGVCVTTWEFTFFSALESVLPVVLAAVRRLASGTTWDVALAAEGGPAYLACAKLLGDGIPAAARFLAPGTWRLLRDRLVMRGNPLQLWREWREEACGPAGDAVLALCDRLDALTAREGDPAATLRGPVQLHRSAVRFVRTVEVAAQHYRSRKWSEARQALQEAEAILAGLRPWLEGVAARGGSVSDVARLEQLCGHVQSVRRRIEALPNGGDARGYVPSFELIAQPGYVPGHQAGWRAE